MLPSFRSQSTDLQYKSTNLIGFYMMETVALNGLKFKPKLWKNKVKLKFKKSFCLFREIGEIQDVFHLLINNFS